MLMAVDPTSLPPLAPVRLDWTVVAFTLVLGVVTTIVFGLAPALRTLRVNLVESLREGGQATVGGHRQRLRSLLVVAEVTLAVVLVIGAALMVRSLSALGRIDLGFKPDNMLTMRVSVPAARYDTPEKVVDFYRQLNEQRARAARRAVGRLRARAAARDHDRRLRSRRRRLPGIAGRERERRLADRHRRIVRGDGRAADARPLVRAGRHASSRRPWP